MSLRDKNGREIKRGDILKVFHFTGARRKKHYMYKQALGIEPIGENKTPYMKISHLSLDDSYFLERVEDKILSTFEIVQSATADLEDRPKRI